MRLSESHEQRPVGAVYSSIRSRKQLPFPSGAQFTESTQESAIVDQLAFSPYVHDLITQPIIHFVHEGKERRYTADVLVEYRVPGHDAERFLIEAKRQKDIEENAAEHAARFAAAERWCQDNCASFCLLDERDIKTAYLQNVRLLAESRAMAQTDDVRDAIATIDFKRNATVATATAALSELGVPYATVAVERAIVERLIDCDLSKPFGAGMQLRKAADTMARPERADPFLATLRKAAKRVRR